MIEVESKRPDGIDFVAIVTPNHLHLPIALAALEAGIPVMSDKPATATYEEALKLEAAVKKASVPYGLTHTYAGYQMVREARAMCAAGKLGKIRKVAVEYFQGWLSRPIESTGQKQAAWRTDPERNGPGGAIGDIGTHAFHLLEYVSGLEVTAINATLRSVVAGAQARRRLQCICADEQRRGGDAGLLAGCGRRDERVAVEDLRRGGVARVAAAGSQSVDCEGSRQAGRNTSRGDGLSGRRCEGCCAHSGGAS